MDVVPLIYAVPARRLCIDPARGLKTRSWQKGHPALERMTDAARPGS